MAWLPRFVLLGHPQHVIIRGNNHDPVFVVDEDWRYFLEKLSDAAKNTGVIFMQREESKGSGVSRTQYYYLNDVSIGEISNDGPSRTDCS